MYFCILIKQTELPMKNGVRSRILLSIYLLILDGGNSSLNLLTSLETKNESKKGPIKVPKLKMIKPI